MNYENANGYPLLSIINLKKYFYIKKGFGKTSILKAVDGVSFNLGTGEVLGLVGESGCGKTTLGRTILKLNKPTSGKIIFDKKDILQLSKRQLRRTRSGMQIVFQDPYSSLNPRLTIGKMLNEILISHGIGHNTERQSRIELIIQKVGLENSHLARFPHEFSGGQRQRIAIARALILYPRIIIADEPSSALDMSIQAQILNLMKNLQKEMMISYLFITHNLSAARFISDKIAVMYLGKIVELADRFEFFNNPLHPYTKALLDLCPAPNPDVSVKSIELKGEVPSPINPPEGCPFHPRCVDAQAICKQQVPVFKETKPSHFVSCFQHIA